ncbi:hypothetical protein ACVWYN_001989 [Pedobacter sp. UYP24]
MQTTNQLLMIRPVNFKFNEQTAVNNKFQQASAQDHVQIEALNEFNNFLNLLKGNEISVTVLDDTLNPETPDSIFPNNWVSFHQSGKVILYPMFSPNRRQERRQDILKAIEKKFVVKEIVDLTGFENSNVFLEGTGSLVLDRGHKIAYACLSVRTNELVIREFCDNTGYQIVSFNGLDSLGFPIYHTNVMMCIADRFAVICLAAIPDETEKEKVVNSLITNGKKIIEITMEQMNHFAGNMLQVENKSGYPLLILSEQAYLSLRPQQINELEKYNRLLYAPLYTIEKNGGGSARCMLAEIHLPLR